MTELAIKVRCGFCGDESGSDGRKFVAGNNGGVICSSCVDLVRDIVADDIPLDFASDQD